MGHESYNERMLRSGQAVRDYRSEKSRRLAGGIQSGRSLSALNQTGHSQASEKSAASGSVILVLLIVAAFLLALLALQPAGAAAAPPELILPHLPSFCAAPAKACGEEAQILGLRAWLARRVWAEAARRSELGARFDCAETGERIALETLSRSRQIHTTETGR